jgi:RNA polymerase sigma-70 factor, sigma-B/F/G subfamily
MQYNKVEISGVNTSKLKVLSEEKKTELLKKTRAGDKAAREELIQGNLRLVLSVIQKFMSRGAPADDLFQVGVVGLIKAIDNFDVNLDVKFSTYAVPMISGELRRYLRDNNAIRVSRSTRDLAYKAMQAREKLMNENNNEPTPAEISKEIGVNKADVVIALESISEPVSIYEPVYSSSGDAVYMLDQLGDSSSDEGWIDELLLREAIKTLSDREKNILYLRFYQGKTQVEVANEIGISQAQVSRLEKNALSRIKSSV